RGSPGRLRHALPPAGDGRRLVRSQLRVPSPPAGPAAAGRRGVRVPAGRRRAPQRRLGRAARCGLHRSIHSHASDMSTGKRKRYWLMKSEPEDFSIDDLERVGTEPWTGVRNYQARNFMRDGMQVGDGVLFYHSNCAVPGIYGIAEVASSAYPDPTQFDGKSKYFDPKSTPEEPRWMLVDVGFVRHLAGPVTLEALRGRSAALGEDFALIRKGTRLSVLPVTAAQWKVLLAMEPK